MRSPMERDDAARRRSLELERHAPSSRLGAQQRLDLARRLEEIETLPFDLVPREQGPQSADHFAGPQVVAADVGEDRGELGPAVRRR